MIRDLPIFSRRETASRNLIHPQLGGNGAETGIVFNEIGIK